MRVIAEVPVSLGSTVVETGSAMAKLPPLATIGPDSIFLAEDTSPNSCFGGKFCLRNLE